MVQVEYGGYVPRIETRQGKEFIFDGMRKQWVVLTPEEWVRQNFLHYLVHDIGYPASLVAVEKEIKLHGLVKRFDIVVYDRQTRPWMIVECKEMGVEISQQVLEQALRYNISLDVPFIVITNGKVCYAFAAAAGRLNELTVLPSYGS
jgi:hypothetical protein